MIAPATQRRPARRSSAAPIGQRSIVVNARYQRQRETGVQRYARELVARMPGLVPLTPRGGGRGAVGHVWEQVVLPWRAGRSLLWSPCNCGPLAVRRQVVTIHDCSCLDRPEGFSPAFAAWYRWLLPRLARRVRRVMTVSEFSRQRLLEWTGVAPDRVVAIANGVDPRFRPSSAAAAEARARLGLPPRYVLSLGSLEPRKNLAGLLAAWRLVGRDDLALVIAGGGSHVFRGLGQANPTPGVQWLGYVDDALLPGLYAGAEAFVYPSLYEGFGLPVLEAMACGTAVVASNAPALVEVAGSAALLASPEPEPLAQALLNLLSDEPLRAELRRRGPQRAGQFSWDLCARRSWQTLTEAAEE